MAAKIGIVNRSSARANMRCVFFSVIVSFTQTVCAIKTEEIYDLPIEDLLNLQIETASRHKQKSSEAPSAVEVLTADDIRSFGWRTLGDALNAVRGIHIRNSRNYEHMGARGFLPPNDYSSRILLMIDGRRFNENVYDGISFGENFLVDMNLIERIEYIPGPGSSIYGANGLMGVVNVITKQGKQIDGLRVAGEVGSLDTYRAKGTFGKRWDNGADLLINASQYMSHGNEQLYFPEFSTTNDGIAQDMDLERSRKLFGKLSYQDFTLRGGILERFKRVPTAPMGSIFNDKDNTTQELQSYLDLDYKTQLSQNLNLELRGFYHSAHHDVYIPLYEHEDDHAPKDGSESSPERVLEFMAGHGRWWGGEVKLSGVLFDAHHWTVGLDLQYDQKQHLIAYDVEPYELYHDSTDGGIRSGLFLQDEYRLTDNLLLNAGLRIDQHHMIDDIQINPRVGLIWDVTPQVTSKLLYSSAFRAPNAFERSFNHPDFGFIANPQLQEEQVESYEATLEWRPVDSYRFMSSFFYNQFDQLIKQPEDQKRPVAFSNKGKFDSYGIELEGEKRWQNGRLLKFSWTYAYATNDDLEEGGWATDSPRHMLKAHYSEPLFDDALRLGFEEVFIGERLTLKENIAPGYHLMNINLSTKSYYGLQASLGIYNVLDQQYKILGEAEHIQDTLAMDGRTVRFRLEYGF